MTTARNFRLPRGVAQLTLLLAGVFCGVGRLSAQTSGTVFVHAGERVRVTTLVSSPYGATRTGVLQRVARDSVTVEFTGGERETLAFDRLRLLEVSDGRRSFVARGMGYGFITGGLVGAAVGLAQHNDGNDYFPRPAVAAVTGVLGGLAGTVVGGVIGALGRGERWTRVRLEQPLRRVTLMPALIPGGAGPVRGGTQVGVRFATTF